MEEVIKTIISELPIPAGQGWVTIDEILDKAREIDDDKSGRNS